MLDNLGEPGISDTRLRARLLEAEAHLGGIRLESSSENEHGQRELRDFLGKSLKRLEETLWTETRRRVEATKTLQGLSVRSGNDV